MIHRRFNIAIYGNLIYDEIYTLQKPFTIGHGNNGERETRGGGIANLIRAFDKLQFNWEPTIVGNVGKDVEGEFLIQELADCARVRIEQVNEPTSRATIIVDKFANQRTSLMAWGACRSKRTWPTVKADWHHIMYLDRTTIDPSQMTGIISADICNTSLESISQYLPYLDYLFISDYKHSGPIPVKQGIISHSPDAIDYYTHKGTGQYIISKETGLNVLGAGDYLAACIINGLSMGTLDLEEAHQQTLQLLRRQSK